MTSEQETSAGAVAVAAASAVGLRASDAVVLPGGGNRFAVRVLPCDTLVRVGDAAAHRDGLALEVSIALALAATDASVAGLDPRVEAGVHDIGTMAATFWTYHEPVGGSLAPAVYADALRRLHAATVDVEIAVPHLRDRVDGARRAVADVAATPDLRDDDRSFLLDAIDGLLDRVLERAGGVEQLLHGEPHPGNVVLTAGGPLLIDLETGIRGPVAFDVAHAPDDVARHYPGLDAALVDDCRRLALALATTWRWERDDSFPDGRFHGEEGLRVLRSGGRAGGI